MYLQDQMRIFRRFLLFEHGVDAYHGELDDVGLRSLYRRVNSHAFCGGTNERQYGFDAGEFAAASEERLSEALAARSASGREGGRHGRAGRSLAGAW